ncbi:hypothetical protein SALBM217S_07347 [Streptomyces griseoloalbus]
MSAGDADGRELTESLATMGVIAAMYDEAAWQRLREALTSAMKESDGAGLLVLSDSYYERDAGGAYSNLMSANAAVNCLDLPPAFESPDDVRAALPDFEKASPVFGEGLAWAALNCAYWPVRATGEAQRIEAKGAAPIVVVGTTRDPATPYRWAKGLAAQLSSARLLTYDGDGHTVMAAAAPASTRRSTRTCSRAPRRRTESAARSGYGHPRRRRPRPASGGGNQAPPETV